MNPTDQMFHPITVTFPLPNSLFEENGVIFRNLNYRPWQ